MEDRLGAGQGPDYTGLWGHDKAYGFILFKLGATGYF